MANLPLKPNQAPEEESSGEVTERCNKRMDIDLLQGVHLASLRRLAVLIRRSVSIGTGRTAEVAASLTLGVHGKRYDPYEHEARGKHKISSQHAHPDAIK